MVMNALFGGAIKVFLALLQTQNAVGQDHGDGADGGDGRRGAEVSVGGHGGLYRPAPDFFSALLPRAVIGASWNIGKSR